MPYVLITPAASEPLTLADAKLHLRIDVTADDTLISALISAAREFAEMATQRQLVTATWKLVLDAFPGHSQTGIAPGVSFSMPSWAVRLEKSPVQAVSQIRYMDMGGTWNVMPSTDYVVDTSCEPARITPVFGKIWPITQPQIGAVEITFTAGYVDAVPEGIKSWMKIRIGSLYQHREEMAVIPTGRIEPLPFVDRLLDPYRVVNY